MKSDFSKITVNSPIEDIIKCYVSPVKQNNKITYPAWMQFEMDASKGIKRDTIQLNKNEIKNVKTANAGVLKRLIKPFLLLFR